MALAIKCLHNLSPQFSYVSTLPKVWRYAIVSCMPETRTALIGSYSVLTVYVACCVD